MSVLPLSVTTQDWLKRPVPFWINGAGVTSETKKSLINPANGQAFAEVYSADASHVDSAVEVARNCFDTSEWTTMNPSQRARIMWRLADLVDQHAQQLGELESLCMGKPLVAAAHMEVPFFAETLRYYAGWCSKISGNAAALCFPAGDLHGLTIHDPVGVVGMILPWNGPLVIAGWKLAPALATGCTCVIKPADCTPLSLLYFAQLAQQAGLPDGVLNIVTGAGSIVGAAIAAHPHINKLAFTGSTSVGRQLVQASGSSNLKQLTLELGGKSPIIIFADTDLSAAVDGIADAIFGNSGQVCVAGSRLYVHTDIRAKLVERLIAKAATLKVGNPFDEHTDMGPLASHKHREQVHRRVQQGISQGAQLLCGGQYVELDGGAYYPPTILSVVDQNNPLVQEEIFGPVLVVAEFTNEAEVIELANGTDYALAGSVWTQNIDLALRMARRLYCGIVWVNSHNIPDLNMPIGGHGMSGWGRELGQAGLMEYLQTKSVMIKIAPTLETL